MKKLVCMMMALAMLSGAVMACAENCIMFNYAAEVGAISGNLVEFKSCTGLWGYMNLQGELAVTPRFSWVRDFNGDVAVVYDMPGYGVINQKGEMVVETIYPQYDYKHEKTYVDSVCMLDEEGNRHYYDATGEISEDQLIPWVEEDSTASAVPDEVIQQLGTSEVDTLDGSEHVYRARLNDSKRADVLYNAETNRIILYDVSAGWEVSDGLISCYSDGRYFFINEQGDVVIPPLFENALNFSEGYAVVRYDSNADAFYYVDTQGKIAAGPYESAYSFENGVAIVYVDGQYHMINKAFEFLN